MSVAEVTVVLGIVNPVRLAQEVARADKGVIATRETIPNTTR
jgi:hypothetical protein